MKRYLIIAVLAIMACATSCTHKDLCEDHREHAHRYHIQIIADYRYDWEEQIYVDSLVQKAKEMQEDGMDYVEISLFEDTIDIPAFASFSGLQEDMPNMYNDYEDIEAVKPWNDVLYVDAQVVEPDALPSPMLTD